MALLRLILALLLTVLITTAHAARLAKDGDIVDILPGGWSRFCSSSRKV